MTIENPAAVQVVTQTRTPLAAVLRAPLDNIERSGRSPARVIAGFAGAWLVFLAFCYAPAPSGLSSEGMAVLAIVLWASIMWVTEAMPVGITGLAVPLLLIVTRAIPWTVKGAEAQPPMAAAFGGFTNEVVWLCLFAFMLGAVMQLTKLDRRIAMAILDRTRASTVDRVIWGMFGVNVVLAFFIPAANARAAVMLPIVLGVANLMGDTAQERECQKAIVIQAHVYASMISGMFILTAHLPNLILVNLFAAQGHSINYLHWMLLHFPYLGMFAITFYWTRWFFRTKGVAIAGGSARIHKMHQDLGPMSAVEYTLLGVFIIVALLFLLSRGSPVYELHTYPLGVIGLIGMMVLFTPGLFPLRWRQIEAQTLWGTFLLLGGALTLTSAMSSSGLAVWLADHVHGLVGGMGWWLAMLVVLLGTHVIRLGMLSNVAAVALLAPITYALAQALHLNPVAFATLVCNNDSFSYILPTQITAAVIAYGSGKFSTFDYAKVGLGSTLIGILYTLLVMVPWYAFVGLPVWNPDAPWPF
jgi:sodium-dependent dicarboxylate transporter 2/3/5